MNSSDNVLSSGYAVNMQGVAAVDRAMAIVQALEKAREPLTLSEIAKETRLYKSAILRLIVSLERCGLVVRREDQRYFLGHFAFRLGKAYDAGASLEVALLPLMKQLVQKGMESPSFHVVHGDKLRLCVLRLDSMHSTLDRVRVGDLLPLNVGAPGKVLRGLSAPPELKSGNVSLHVSYGERDPACGALAGPVYGPGNVMFGSLSLSGPLERFTPETIKPMVPILLDACQTATIYLGGEWPDFT